MGGLGFRARGYDSRVTFQPNRIAVIGVTGLTGIHLVRELTSRGRMVRAVSSRRDRLEELFGREEGVEIATADALEPDLVSRVVEGSDLVIDCIGLPPERMADHPKTARVISTAARAAGARCLQISSYWSFFPHEGEVVGEDHPRESGHEWFHPTTLEGRVEDGRGACRPRG